MYRVDTKLICKLTFYTNILNFKQLIMKKTLLTLTCFSLMFFSLQSCGGSSSQADDAMDKLDQLSEMSSDYSDEEESDDSNDFSSLTSAQDAMEEYKSMLEDYAEKVKSGEVDAAAELKDKLDELKSYTESTFAKGELKALGELTKLAIALESGKNVDLKTAFGAYEKSLELLKNIPMDKDAEDALKTTKDAMDALKGLGGL